MIFAGAAVALWAGLRSTGLWPALELDALERGGNAFLFPGRAWGSLIEARTASVVDTLLSALAVRLLLGRLGSVTAGRVAALMIATAPVLVARARFVGTEAHMMAAVALTLACFGIASLGPMRSPWPRCAVLCFGLVFAVPLYHRGPLLLAAVAAAIVLTRLATAHGDRWTTLSTAITGSLGLAGGVAFLRTHPLLVSVTSFDAPLAQLGHEAFPFSALAPLVFIGAAQTTAARLGALFLTTLYGAELATSSFGAPLAHVLPLGFVVALAGALGDRSEAPSRVALVCVAVAAAILAVDFARLPEKIALCFGSGTTLPAAARDSALLGYRLAAAGLGGSVLVAFVWRSPRLRLLPFVGALLGALVVRIVALESIARAASPRGAVEISSRIARPGEPLALLGVDPRVARYLTRVDASVMPSPEAAADWLLAADARRFVVVPRDGLAPVNARYRATRHSNLPVIETPGSDLLVVSDRLLPGEKSDSVLDRVVLGEVPASFRPRAARFADALDLVGFTVVGEQDAPSSLSTTSTRHLRVAMRVRHAIGSGQFCTFVHVERSPTRFSDEHREWAVYPMRHWAEGDVVVDDFAIRLPAAFRRERPNVYYGVGVLPCADDRRMPLTEGAGSENRALLGALEVE